MVFSIISLSVLIIYFTVIFWFIAIQLMNEEPITDEDLNEFRLYLMQDNSDFYKNE